MNLIRLFASGVLLLGCTEVGGVANVDELAICEGGTVEQLRRADRISDRCRAAVHDYLPNASSTTAGRLVAFGGQQDGEGPRRFYLHGVSEDGVPFDDAEFQALTATVARPAGDAITVGGDVLSVARVPASEELLSIAFVNDYSASMRDTDLEAIAAIEAELASVLPAAFEAEVTLFSSTVTVRQPFTTESDSAAAALEPDLEFPRNATALYAGMRVAVESLVTRPRPVRLVVVATDGVDNASEAGDRSTVLQMLEEHSIAVVVLGSLFADADELGDLGGSRGVFFYERSAPELPPLLAPYLASLRELVEIVVPAEYAEGATYTFALGGESVTVTI